MTYGIIQTFERLIVHAIFQRHVYRVTFSFSVASIILCPCSWKEFAKFVEAASHNPIRRVERLLNTVTVVAIDVDIQDTRISSQKLQDTEDNVIDVAEPGCFALFGMVKPSCPIDSYVGGSRVNLLRCS